MKTIFVLAILYFLITGCSSTYVISSSSSSNEFSVIEFNKYADGREAKIILKDKVVTDATNVYLSTDSLSWSEPENILKSKVVKSDVRRVIFKNHWVGGLEWGAIGIPSGGIAGFLIAWASGGGLGAILIIPGFGVIVGAIAGIITGSIIGHTYEYEFE